MKNPNTIAVVAARGGSKGVPGKNIRPLGGIPLVGHALKTLCEIPEITRVILSTDSSEIAGAVEKLGLRVEIRKRPADLAQDNTPLTSVAHHVALELEKEGQRPDFVLQIAPTCPFIRPETVRKVLDYLHSGKTNCAVTLSRIEHAHPYRAKVLQEDGSFTHFITDVDVEKFISRQSLPTLYCTSGAIYGRSYELLKTFTAKDFCLGSKPYGVVVDDIEAVNIDRPIDFDFAEFLWSRK